MTAPRSPAPALVALALALAATAAPWPARADRVSADPPTAWGHPTMSDSSVRGVAFDGDRWFVADCMDHVVDGRPRDNTGRIYLYDLAGHLIKRIPETPPVRGTYFGHGVATDGARVWTSGYFDPHVYEYDISTGQLLRRFDVPVQVIRLDYLPERDLLLATRYGDSRVYGIAVDGRVDVLLDTHFTEPNLDVVPDGRGDLWVAHGVSAPGGQLARIDGQSAVLQTYGHTGWSAIGTNIHARDDGYVQDLAPVWSASQGQWVARLQHVGVRTVGGTATSLATPAVSCEDARTGQRRPAHVAGAHWNCEDGGLDVSAGDVVTVTVSGTVR